MCRRSARKGRGMKNRYGNIIKKEREAADMTLEELASLLLMTPESLAAVERAEDTLSDFRLNMIANTFHISKGGLIQGVRYPRMDTAEIAGMLENISKEISELKQMQELLERQIQGEKVNNAGMAEPEGSTPEMNIHTLPKEISLEERYTIAMEMAGYEPAQTEPDNMATVTFKTRNPDRMITFDGWQAVGMYLEDVVLSDETEARRFDELIHPQGRIQFVTRNLDGEGLMDGNNMTMYPDIESALHAYLNTGIVDGKAIGFRMAGQDASLHAVDLAHFDTVDMSNHMYGLSYVKRFVPEAAMNELEQIESMGRKVYDELIKENAYMKIWDTFHDLSMRARTDIARQNSEWGSWFGHIANSYRPQDYVEIDITGYSTHHEVVYTVAVLHANEIVDSKTLSVDIDRDNLVDAMEKAYTTAQNEFGEFLKEAVEKLDTDLEYPMTAYTPYTENGIWKHREQLDALGYRSEEKEERNFHGDSVRTEELEEKNSFEEPEEEILPEREISM